MGKPEIMAGLWSPKRPNVRYSSGTWLAKHDPETHTAFARALKPQASLDAEEAVSTREDAS
jgi:hypothetical protein